MIRKLKKKRMFESGRTYGLEDPSPGQEGGGALHVYNPVRKAKRNCSGIYCRSMLMLHLRRT
eukprot:4621037-Pyramimonas_sp.AAC.1